MLINAIIWQGKKARNIAFIGFAQRVRAYPKCDQRSQTLIDKGFI
jgi:hypothetical protein